MNPVPSRFRIVFYIQRSWFSLSSISYQKSSPWSKCLVDPQYRRAMSRSFSSVLLPPTVCSLRPAVSPGPVDPLQKEKPVFQHQHQYLAPSYRSRDQEVRGVNHSPLASSLSPSGDGSLISTALHASKHFQHVPFRFLSFYLPIFLPSRNNQSNHQAVYRLAFTVNRQPSSVPFELSNQAGDRDTDTDTEWIYRRIHYRI